MDMDKGATWESGGSRLVVTVPLMSVRGVPGVEKTMIFSKSKVVFLFFLVLLFFLFFFGFWFFNLKKEKMQYAYCVYCSAFTNTKLL